MISPAFWDRLALANDGGPCMTRREAARIVRSQRVYCLKYQGRPDLICTGGTRDYPADLYDYALLVVLGHEPALPEPLGKRPRARKAEA